MFSRFLVLVSYLFSSANMMQCVKQQNILWASISFYRPQTKFGATPHSRPPGSRPPWDQAPPREQTPLGPGTPPWEQTPWDQAPPKEQTPAEQAPPCAVHAGRYGQQAGGMHPTGMQSCFSNTFGRRRWVESKRSFILGVKPKNVHIEQRQSSKKKYSLWLNVNEI